MAPKKSHPSTADTEGTDKALQLIREIRSLFPGLTPLKDTLMPEATTKDVIYRCLQEAPADTRVHELWVGRFDKIIHSSTRNKDGRLTKLRQGRKGLSAFVASLSTVISEKEKEFYSQWETINPRLKTIRNELVAIM